MMPPSAFDKYLRLFSYYGDDQANRALLAVDDPSSNFLRAMDLATPSEQCDLDSFEDFQASFLPHPNLCCGLAFRGQPGDWPLRSTLGRMRANLSKIYDTFPSPPPPGDNKSIRLEVHERINALLNPLRMQLEPQIDFVWAMMQHYGGATPLLDWTQSMDVALFFAFDRLPAPDQDRVWIWIADIGKSHCMNFMATEGRHPESSDLIEGDYEQFADSCTFVWPVTFRDVRFPLQHSLFLYEGDSQSAHEEHSFDTFIERASSDSRFRPLPGTLMSITLPASEREKVMTYLMKKGITRDRLFMSWDGVVDHLMSDITDYMLDQNSMHAHNLTVDEMHEFQIRRDD